MVTFESTVADDPDFGVTQRQESPNADVVLISVPLVGGSDC